MKYSYQKEKISSARSSLMLPHPKGEAYSIAQAYFEIQLGLKEVRESDLSEDPQGWIKTLREIMNTDGIDDPHSIGLNQLRAEQLTEEEKFKFSRLVEELADWFSDME